MNDFVSKEALGETCMDGGKCHHKENCTERCFRRECCVPLTLAMDEGLTMEQWRYPQSEEACNQCEPQGVFDIDGSGPFDCYNCGKKAASQGVDA